MFDHVSIKVKSFPSSLAFYRAALAPLGHEAQYVDEAGKSAGFGPKGSPMLWIAEGPGGGAVHIAVKATSREAVKGFYDAAIATGGRDNGKPGPRPDYSDTYYAAFALDPDGNNIEVVTFAAT